MNLSCSLSRFLWFSMYNSLFAWCCKSSPLLDGGDVTGNLGILVSLSFYGINVLSLLVLNKTLPPLFNKWVVVVSSKTQPAGFELPPVFQRMATLSWAQILSNQESSTIQPNISRIYFIIISLYCSIASLTGSGLPYNITI